MLFLPIIFPVIKFSKKQHCELAVLLEKYDKKILSLEEEAKLDRQINNDKKETKTKELILSLKKIRFV